MDNTAKHSQSCLESDGTIFKNWLENDFPEIKNKISIMLMELL